MIFTALLLGAAAQVGVARLEAELRTNPSATAVLQARCDTSIRAVVDRGARSRPSRAQRRRLGIGPHTLVRYRRLDLNCGGRTYSRAENWYVPGRLTPEMNAALESGDAPYGVVVRPLGAHRRLVASSRRGLARGQVLRVRALVLDRENRPLAEVVETYLDAAAQ